MVTDGRKSLIGSKCCHRTRYRKLKIRILKITLLVFLLLLIVSVAFAIPNPIRVRTVSLHGDSATMTFESGKDVSDIKVISTDTHHECRINGYSSVTGCQWHGEFDREENIWPTLQQKIKDNKYPEIKYSGQTKFILTLGLNYLQNSKHKKIYIRQVIDGYKYRTVTCKKDFSGKKYGPWLSSENEAINQLKKGFLDGYDWVESKEFNEALVLNLKIYWKGKIIYNDFPI